MRTVSPDFLLKDVHVFAELRDRIPRQVEPEGQLAHLVRDEPRDRLHLHDVRICRSDLQETLMMIAFLTVNTNI